MSNVKQLEQKILYHKRKYYEGNPEISDSEFDAIEKELKKIDPKNPVLDIVGGDFSISKDKKVNHDIVMLSCQKAKDWRDIVKFVNMDDLTVSYKVDGLSCSLIYENGILVQASTRGDGKVGQDITANAMQLTNIPKRLNKPVDIEVRGEVYLPNSIFKTMKSLGYKSPRNVASGTLTGDHANLVSERKLRFMGWDILSRDKNFDTNSIDTYAKTWAMEDLGFEVAEYDNVRKGDTSKLKQTTEDIMKNRKSIDFDIDGLVFKISNGKLRDSMGATSHHPKWQIAWKFPSEGDVTDLKDIVWQVGRTGKVTPVAILAPVEVAGATIQRATLNNLDYITNGKLKGIGIGDKVYITRAGDVIPYVASISVSNGRGFPIPTQCPDCGSPLRRDGVDLFCDNLNCPGRQIGTVEHWVKIIKIDKFGTETINNAHAAGKLSGIEDIYLLQRDYMVNTFGVNGGKVYDNIQKARTVPYEKFINAIGLDFVGKGTAGRVVKVFPTIDDFLNASIDDISKVPDVGKRTATSLFTGKKRIRELLKIITIKYPRKTIVASGKLKDMKIYVSGKIFGLKKDEARALIESHGGIWKGFSKGLNLLISGSRPGPAKLAKAKTWGMRVVDEQWLESQGIKP